MFTKVTGRTAGQRGGQARSKSLAPEKRQDIARRAAASRWGGGSKNKISTEVKQNVAEFFKTLTIENHRWRTNMRRKLEMAADSGEFIQLSRLALSYSPGLPVKMQPEGEKRESLIFLGLRPW
jgi:hypothetical protein